MYLQGNGSGNPASGAGNKEINRKSSRLVFFVFTRVSRLPAVYKWANVEPGILVHKVNAGWGSEGHYPILRFVIVGSKKACHCENSAHTSERQQWKFEL